MLCAPCDTTQTAGKSKRTAPRSDTKTLHPGRATHPCHGLRGRVCARAGLLPSPLACAFICRSLASDTLGENAEAVAPPGTWDVRPRRASSSERRVYHFLAYVAPTAARIRASWL